MNDNIRPVDIWVGKRYATIVVDIRADERSAELTNWVLDELHAALVVRGCAGLRIVDLVRVGIPVAQTQFAISAMHAGMAIRLGVTYAFNALDEHAPPFEWPDWNE